MNDVEAYPEWIVQYLVSAQQDCDIAVCRRIQCRLLANSTGTVVSMLTCSVITIPLPARSFSLKAFNTHHRICRSPKSVSI